jgi:hypothetical protein
MPQLMADEGAARVPPGTWTVDRARASTAYDLLDIPTIRA